VPKTALAPKESSAKNPNARTFSRPRGRRKGLRGGVIPALGEKVSREKNQTRGESRPDAQAREKKKKKIVRLQIAEKRRAHPLKIACLIKMKKDIRGL